MRYIIFTLYSIIATIVRWVSAIIERNLDMNRKNVGRQLNSP